MRKRLQYHNIGGCEFHKSKDKNSKNKQNAKN